MQKLLLFVACSLTFHSFSAYAQQPQKPDAVAIYQQIKKLGFLGSVLYIAAHPDDENTRLISYFANETSARTGYLSLTRGDGGQNLIGPELRELLGVIRTQELIEARKIDGGEQFFSRANDFGYSKNPDETLKIWNKDAVLSDIVTVIRKFQPDIIINRFDARTPGTTHGHHTASAILSLEAFDKSADKNYNPIPAQSTRPWQPKRLFYNTSWWAYGKEKFDKLDKSQLYKINTGVYFSSLGKSNQEIAALSRSSHKSQGFGSTGTRGDDAEYLEFIKGDEPLNKSLFDGIDTTWNRVKNGQPIGTLVQKIENNFDFRNPAASVPELLKAYSLISAIDDPHWKAIKLAEIKTIIANCSGLFLETVADKQQAVPGSDITINIEAINRSAVPMKLSDIVTTPISANAVRSIDLPFNQPINKELTLHLPENTKYTQPYWLEQKATTGMYAVADAANIGRPDVVRDITVTFNIIVSGTTIPFERTVVYKYNDQAKGEVYQPFDIVPDVTTSAADKVAIFADSNSRTISIAVKAGRDNVSGNVQLQLPTGWKSIPASAAFAIASKGQSQNVTFTVSAPAKADEATAEIIATVDGKQFDNEQINIDYPHISKQIVLKPSEIKLIKLDIKTGNERIAYVMGAGDEVPKSLKQMGYQVTILKPEEITKNRLASFDVIMTGIRAYNTVDELALKQQLLFDFVAEGKTMIVQYNTAGDFVTNDIAPFPLKISRDRVTEEDAEITFLDLSNPLLNYPNKITAADFSGWTQEQGLYYPNEWDSAFTPIISSHDKGESPKKGALLIANYGKGRYIYTGLSFFRELPEGVPGAFRLMANLISQPQSQK